MNDWTDDAIKMAILDDDMWKDFLAHARILPSPPAREFMDALFMKTTKPTPRLMFTPDGRLTTTPF